MSELTKQDKEVLDITAKEFSCKDWNALKEFSNKVSPMVWKVGENIVVNSRQVTEERMIKEIDKIAEEELTFYSKAILNKLKGRLQRGR